MIDHARRAGQIDLLQAAVDSLTKRLPRSPGGWYLRGMMSEALCDTGAARAAYEQASRVVRPGAGAFLAGRPNDPPATPCIRS